MKRTLLVFMLAVMVLAVAMPKPSEANGAWVPAAVIGGIIVGAAFSHAAHAAPVYVCPAHSRVYVNPPPRINSCSCRHEQWRKHKYRHTRRPIPPRHREDRRYR